LRTRRGLRGKSLGCQMRREGGGAHPGMISGHGLFSGNAAGCGVGARCLPDLCSYIVRCRSRMSRRQDAAARKHRRKCLSCHKGFN
jgi:hypothetical protein